MFGKPFCTNTWKLQLNPAVFTFNNFIKGWLQQNDLRSQMVSSILGVAMGCRSFEGLIRGTPCDPLALSNTTSASWKCLSRSACPQIHCDSNQKHTNTLVNLIVELLKNLRFPKNGSLKYQTINLSKVEIQKMDPYFKSVGGASWFGSGDGF